MSFNKGDISLSPNINDKIPKKKIEITLMNTTFPNIFDRYSGSLRLFSEFKYRKRVLRIANMAIVETHNIIPWVIDRIP